MISSGDISSQYLKLADIGGATGTYSFKLADHGHQVHLRDLSPRLIEIATAKQAQRSTNRLASIAVGNAIDPLLFPSSEAGSFDAVLLMGPLYHLIEEEERVAAIRNGLSLLKEDGVLFAAFISQNAHLRDIAVRAPERLIQQREFYEMYLRTGKYVRRGEKSVESYHAKYDELRPLIEKAGGETVEVVGTEGILGGGLDNALIGASEELLNAWVLIMTDLGRRVENLGNADHWLVVVKKAGH